MNKKIFLVAGANSGLGRGCSFLLAQQGYHVLKLCRSAERGQEGGHQKARDGTTMEIVKRAFKQLGILLHMGDSLSNS